MYYATADEMEKLDEVAVENGLEIRQMMELAGWHMLCVFDELGVSFDAAVAITVGHGNKGGDGLSAARHLINHGWQNVRVVLAGGEESLKPDPAHHLALLQGMQVPVEQWSADTSLADVDVVIDALLGYHLNGAPRSPFDAIIEAVNASGAQVVAYDMPSGVDATSGECREPCIKADATLTLALPKRVFQEEAGVSTSGTVYLGDIGIPAWMYREATGGERPAFSGLGVRQVAEE